MQHTTKTAKFSSHKDKKEKTDEYLLYDTTICRRVGARLQDTVEGEEKKFRLV